MSIEEKEAAHGQKMIEIKVRFWTDSIAEDKGKIVPKHALSSGVVRIARNGAHGIVPGKPLPFNSLAEIAGVVEKCLINHGIRLHPSRKMSKYFER